MACALTCATCLVCEDPEPIDGFEVVFQYGLIGESLAVYLDSTAIVAGVQADVFCSVGGRRIGAGGMGEGAEWKVSGDVWEVWVLETSRSASTGGADRWI